MISLLFFQSCYLYFKHRAVQGLMELECADWNMACLLQEACVTRYWQSDMGSIVCTAA